MSAPYSQVIAACLFAFLGYWLWSARHIRLAKRTESVGSMVVSNLLMWPGSVLLVLGSLPHQPAWSIGLPASDIRSLVGTALVIVGVGFAIWSRRKIGANWSRVARIAEGQQLITTGPYRLVRNPIYSGILLAVFGIALTAGTIVAFIGVAFVFASLWRKSLVEERLLASEFGEQYAAYSRRTRRLIPFLL